MSGRPWCFAPQGKDNTRRDDSGRFLVAFTAINGASKRIAHVWDATYSHVTIDGVRYQHDGFGVPGGVATNEIPGPYGGTLHKFTELK